MFGFSFGELVVISLVALVAVGPQKLPGMLKTMGQWARKLRKMTMDVRQQTGIDEMLRAEGIQLSELRTLMRGYHGGPFAAAAAAATAPSPAAAAPTAPAASPFRYEDPYGNVEPDPTREYPLEGADAYGALPDDLMEPSPSEVGVAPGPAPVLPPEAPSAPVAAAAPEAVPAPVAAAAPAVAPAPAPAPVPSASAAPPAAPVRSVPPPPPSRTGAPRPSGNPPPPPRRSAAPRPEGSSPINKPEPAAPAASADTNSPGTVNGNG